MQHLQHASKSCEFCHLYPVQGHPLAAYRTIPLACWKPTARLTQNWLSTFNMEFCNYFETVSRRVLTRNCYWHDTHWRCDSRRIELIQWKSFSSQRDPITNTGTEGQALLLPLTDTKCSFQGKISHSANPKDCGRCFSNPSCIGLKPVHEHVELLRSRVVRKEPIGGECVHTGHSDNHRPDILDPLKRLRISQFCYDVWRRLLQFLQSLDNLCTLLHHGYGSKMAQDATSVSHMNSNARVNGFHWDNALPSGGSWSGWSWW